MCRGGEQLYVRSVDGSITAKFGKEEGLRNHFLCSFSFLRPELQQHGGQVANSLCPKNNSCSLSLSPQQPACRACWMLDAQRYSIPHPCGENSTGVVKQPYVVLRSTCYRHGTPARIYGSVSVAWLLHSRLPSPPPPSPSFPSVVAAAVTSPGHLHAIPGARHGRSYLFCCRGQPQSQPRCDALSRRRRRAAGERGEQHHRPSGAEGGPERRRRRRRSVLAVRDARSGDPDDVQQE